MGDILGASVSAGVKSHEHDPHVLLNSVATRRHAFASGVPCDNSHSIRSRQVKSSFTSVKEPSTVTSHASHPQYVALLSGASTASSPVAVSLLGGISQAQGPQLSAYSPATREHALSSGVPCETSHEMRSLQVYTPSLPVGVPSTLASHASQLQYALSKPPIGISKVPLFCVVVSLTVVEVVSFFTMITVVSFLEMAKEHMHDPHDELYSVATFAQASDSRSPCERSHSMRLRQE